MNVSIKMNVVTFVKKKKKGGRLKQTEQLLRKVCHLKSMRSYMLKFCLSYQYFLIHLILICLPPIFLSFSLIFIAPAPVNQHDDCSVISSSIVGSLRGKTIQVFLSSQLIHYNSNSHPCRTNTFFL